MIRYKVLQLSVILLAVVAAPACSHTNTVREEPTHDFAFTYERLDAIGEPATTLQIKDGVATLVRRRSAAAGADGVIGVFRKKITAQQATDLADACRATPQTESHLRPDFPAVSVSAEGRDWKLQRRGALRPDALEALGAIPRNVELLERELLSLPLQTLHLELVRDGETAKVLLLNRGSEEIRCSGGKSRLVIETAPAAKPAEPGVTPLPAVWSPLRTIVLGEDGGDVMIAGGQRAEFDAAPEAIPDGRRLRARFEGRLIAPLKDESIEFDGETYSNSLAFHTAGN